MDNPAEAIRLTSKFIDNRTPHGKTRFLLLLEAYNLVTHNDKVREAFNFYLEAWFKRISDIIQEGVNQGLFKVDDVPYTTRLVACLFQGIAFRHFLASETHPIEWVERSLEDIYDAFLFKNNQQPN